MNKQIKQFIRDGKGNPVGVMIGVQVGKDSYGIGYSVTNKNAGDKYNAQLGLTIATNRANDLDTNIDHSVGDRLPPSQHKELYFGFVARATKFFQGRKPLASTGEKVVV